MLNAIDEYKSSDAYKNALAAQAYYARENEAILNRLTYMQKHGVKDSKVIFHKLCSGEFPRLVKQLSQYLLGNGVSLEEEQKKKLGVKFDNTLQKMGIQALIDGVNWGFWNNDHLLIYRATEFFPLLDEQDGDMKIGVRFWQLTAGKPLYIELYTEDNIVRYKKDSDSGDLEQIAQTPYKQTVRIDSLSTEVINTDNYPNIPIFPLYANELRVSEFNKGIKSLIDAYDFINSDLVDGITLVEGIYWTIKNYGGNDIAQLLKEIEELKATYTDGDAEAKSHNIEIPYNAKQVALELLRKQIRSDFMALDTDTITGGSLTNVAINVAQTDLNLKADLFEWQVVDFVQNILVLNGIEDVTPSFKRRTISNDTETINNFSTMLADGAIDEQFYIEECPLIPDDKQKDLLDRLALSQQEEADSMFELEEDEDDNYLDGDSEIQTLLNELEALGVDL